jgi:asparagine synthase (glutamine-hydrolysing)
MKFSVEGRVPFLDHELVEFAAVIPQNFKIRNGRGKYLLREVAKRYLPLSCLSMPKKGFSLPVDLWMRRELRGFVEEKLSSLKKRGIFEASRVDDLHERFLRKDINYMKVWILVFSELWMEKFIDNDFYAVRS